MKPHQTCAACKFQRRKCSENCLMAPHFPPAMHQHFLNAHKLFGIGKLTKLLAGLPPDHRSTAMATVNAEVGQRVKDPVRGCHGVVINLLSMITQCEDELNRVNALLYDLRSSGGSGSGSGMAQHFDDYKYNVVQQLDPRLHLLQNDIVQERGDGVGEESSVFGLRDEVMLEQDVSQIRDEGDEERDLKVLPFHSTYRLQYSIVQEHSKVAEEFLPQTHQEQSNVFGLRNEVVLEQDVNPIQDEVEEERDIEAVPIHSTYQPQNMIVQEHSNVAEELVPQPYQEQNNVFGSRDEVVVEQDVNTSQDESEEERDV